MATRSLNVVIAGDAKPLGIASKKAVGHMDDVEKRGHRMGKAVALGFAAAGAAAAGALVVGLKKSVDAAVEAEKSQAKLKAQLTASGSSYRAHAKDIDAVIQKHSRLAGVDDEDLQDAFTGIVRATGSVSKAMKDMGLVTDIMRGKNVDAATAGKILEKVHNGNVTALKKMGISIDPVTKAQDKLKESNKNATKEQIDAAKAADKTATANKGIAELQKRFGGQAEAYGKTAAGAQDRFRVAVENVQEKLGAKLLPILATVANAVAKFLSQIDRGVGVGGRFASAISGIGSVVGRAVGFFVDFGRRVVDVFSGGDKGATGSVSKFAGNARRLFALVVAAVTSLGQKISAVFSGSGIGGDLAKIGRAWLKFQGVVSDVVLYIAKRTLPIIVGVIQGLATVVRGVVRIISGILSGDFSKAWEGVKDIVRGVFTAVKAIIRGAWDLLGPAMVSLAKFLIRKLGDGLKALPGALKDALVGAITLAAENVPKLISKALGGLGKAITSGIKAGFEKLNPFGDGLGDGTGMSSIAGLGGGGALMGADADLGPFAGLGATYGLHTTSGIRPGSITSSGNVSYHSSGDAIDMSGPASGMRRFAVALKNRFGGRLRELISPWGELGIKDGKPYRYSGAIQAQHSGANAHVHVAYTGPFGDGVGGMAAGTGDGEGRVFSYMKSHGFSDEQSAAWVGNFVQESGLNAAIVQSNGEGHGLAQWGGSRFAALQSFAASRKKPWQDFQTQLDFVWKELQGSERGSYGAIKSARSLDAAVSAIATQYERAGVIGDRMGPARAALARFAKGGSSGGSSAPGKGKGATGTTQGGKLPKITPAFYEPAEGPSDEAIAAQGYLDRKAGKGARPAKGGGPSRGITPEEGEARDAAAAAAPTEFDFLDAALSQAELTPDKGDDRKALTDIRDFRARAVWAAQASGDPRQLAQANRDFKTAQETLDALNAVADNTASLAEALKGVEGELKRNREFAEGVQATETFQLKKYLADVLGGQVVQGAIGRSFTPGAGVEWAY